MKSCNVTGYHVVSGMKVRWTLQKHPQAMIIAKDMRNLQQLYNYYKTSRCFPFFRA